MTLTWGQFFLAAYIIGAVLQLRVVLFGLAQSRKKRPISQTGIAPIWDALIHALIITTFTVFWPVARAAALLFYNMKGGR